MSETIVAALLVIGVLSFAFTAVGLIVSRNLYDQIHYLAPGSIVGSLAFSAAAIVHEGFSQSGSKAILIALLLLIGNPILSHATARAGRIRRNQQVLPKADEHVPLAEERGSQAALGSSRAAIAAPPPSALPAFVEEPK